MFSRCSGNVYYTITIFICRWLFSGSCWFRGNGWFSRLPFWNRWMCLVVVCPYQHLRVTAPNHTAQRAVPTNSHVRPHRTRRFAALRRRSYFFFDRAAAAPIEKSELGRMRHRTLNHWLGRGLQCTNVGILCCANMGLLRCLTRPVNSAAFSSNGWDAM